MDTLIANLLTLAREGEAVTDIEQVSLPNIIERCWANTETAGATAVTDIDRSVQADDSRLKQVFENLFRNAIEHGGESVTVTIGGLADGFYIADDGPGIPLDDRNKVFGAGYSTSDDGTGFGLSIVEQIVTAHGWEIQFVDGFDGGAKFEITGVKFAGK